MNDSSSPWTMTPVGMGCVVLVALLTMVAVAAWSPDDRAIRADAPGPIGTSAPGPEPSVPASTVAARAMTPSPATIAGCNRYAASRIAQRTATAGIVVRDTEAVDASDAQVSAAVHSGPAALHGLDESRAGDERYRRAYASCMRSRGYTN